MATSNNPPLPDSLIKSDKCKAYWETVESDANGMLGGVLAVMPSVSRIDLQGSRTFLARLNIGIKSGRQKVPRVLEGGAGIGRVTEGLLLKVADQVDIVEPVAKFTDTLSRKPGVGDIYNVGLEKWEPAKGVKYDLIWIQWCIGHLNDDELLQFLERCKAALEREHGIIVFKENLSTWGHDKFDELDGSVTREDEKFQHLFKKAGLRLIKSDMQRGFPVVKNRQLLPLKIQHLDDTLSVADYQTKFDEIAAIREAAKTDLSMSNDQKRQIAREFSAARRDLRVASQAAMVSTPKPSSAASKSV
ncbi:hypothetical protein F66182_6985 [Fusarium sp. NRRL 66182]|nr:hypothetical protein F66182_6985 [Fusarium sp. NRRL 66182]